MRILLLVHSFNSLSQRCYVELMALGHEVSVEFDINDHVLTESVDLYRPDIIIAPFLKRAIPETIWRRLPCLIVHPGIIGDRGPSALDWAILNEEQRWGVTVLEAEAEMDAGPVWATSEFDMRQASKSSLYKNEVAGAAIAAIKLALKRFTSGDYSPQKPDPKDPAIRGKARPPARQSDRLINWSTDHMTTIMRKIQSGDGMPGVRAELYGETVYLFDPHPAPDLSGNPGEIVAKSGPAIAIACREGTLWIGHVKIIASAHPFKLPATFALAQHVQDLPEIAVDSAGGYQEISYFEAGDVGYLRFDFYNGAMGKEQCERLLVAYQKACTRPTKVIVLLGGMDFWSNGMHLNLIEAAGSAADESWANINAIDDLAESIIRTESHLTIAALAGNAGAGGVFLARSTDYVWLRRDIILNPHYKDMGNLYGSEFWTYLLPRYAGEEKAEIISEARLPMGTVEAVELGLGDEVFGATPSAFQDEVKTKAEYLASSPDFEQRLQDKQRQRLRDETHRPLHLYREDELNRMRMNFYGFDPSYHVARYNFVYKIPKSRTPVTIARHRNRQNTSQHPNQITTSQISRRVTA